MVGAWPVGLIAIDLSMEGLSSNWPDPLSWNETVERDPLTGCLVRLGFIIVCGCFGSGGVDFVWLLGIDSFDGPIIEGCSDAAKENSRATSEGTALSGTGVSRIAGLTVWESM